MTVFNMTGLTAISREGNNWYVNKYLPVSIKTMFYGKVIMAWLVAIAQFLVFAVVLVAVLKPPFILIMLCLILSFLGIWIHNLIGVLVDLHHPMVDWETEQQLFKNRWIGLLHILLVAVLFGLITGGSVYLSSELDLSVWMLFGCMVVALAIVTVALKVYIDKKVVAAWGKI
jgi:ABC-2 type transport system permease protein